MRNLICAYKSRLAKCAHRTQLYGTAMDGRKLIIKSFYCFAVLGLFCTTIIVGQSFNETCDTCAVDSSLECAVTSVELSFLERCRCDTDCVAYGDCCSDRPMQCADEPIADSMLLGLACLRTENVLLESYVPSGVGLRDAYWMVSVCPEDWLVDENAQRREVQRNCTANVALPPVSDSTTGFTYKNEYCAVCNGVRSIIPWQYELGCTQWLAIQLELARQGLVVFELDLDIIARECLTCSYRPPSFNLSSNARACYPHVSTCLSEDELPTNFTSDGESYDQLVKQCASGPFNLVADVSGGTVYRNQYCAMCNAISEVMCAELPGVFIFFPTVCEMEVDALLGDQDRTPVPMRENITELPFIRAFPFSIVLDVTSSGVMISSQNTGTVPVTVTCNDGELYDPMLESCRPTVCPGVFVGGGCVFDTDSNTTISCPTGFIQLTEDDAFELLTNSTLMYADEVYDIAYYENNNPVICPNLDPNATIILNVTDIFYDYPTAYFVLTYIGCSLSVVGTSLTLLSLLLFKEVRTLATMVLANLAVGILIANLLIVGGGPVVEASQNRDLCVSIGILLHFFVLSQFTWMTILSIEIIRTLFRGIRLRQPPSKQQNQKTFLLYFLLGWSLPLLIVTISIIVNFTPSSSHLVLYGRLEDGRDGLCWINHQASAIIAFLVPIALSVFVNLVLLVLTTIILVNITRNSVSKTSSFVYIRVYVAVFVTSGATWVFGFIALLVGAEWAWYPFIVLNSIQGFMLFLAFFFSKKVGSLYLYFFSCEKLDYRTTRTSSGGKSSSVAPNPHLHGKHQEKQKGIELDNVDDSNFR